MAETIASGSNPSEVLGKKAAKAVSKALRPDEQVQAVLSGSLGEALVGTDQRLHIFKRIAGGLDSLEGRSVGAIQLDNRGRKVVVSKRTADGTLQPLNSKAIFIEPKDKADAKEAVTKLQELFGVHEEPGAANASQADAVQSQRPPERLPNNQDHLQHWMRAGAIRGVPPDLAKLNLKASEAVSAELQPDEEVRVIVTGPSGQAIVGTDRRAFVYKKGFMAGATFGKKVTTYDYENITGIELHMGAMNGAVEIHAPGEISIKTSYWSNDKDAPWKARNAIPVTRGQRGIEGQVAKLRELIAAWNRREPSHEVQGQEQQPDLLAQIEKLGKLRDQGLLTSEEFETKKVELLKRL